ncbi:MAG: two-component regulator propeller domain-containing protein [Chryseolinea sp.]
MVHYIIKARLSLKGPISLFLVVFASFVCSNPSFAQSGLSGLPFIRNFSPLEYKAGIQNWAVTQDKRGIMFFANNYGLLEFDGNAWRNYGMPNGSKMRSVAIDEDGKIYVGAQGNFGFFFPDERGNLVYTSLSDKLPEAQRNFDETWNLYIDQDRIYFCTLNYIYMYSKGKFTVIESEGKGLELSFYGNRQLYTYEKNRGLMKLQGDSLRAFPGGEFFLNKSVSSILQQSRDALLISTFQDGVFELKEGRLSVWNERNQEFFKNSNVNCMLHLKNGNFAFGTQNNGLLVLNSKGDLIMELASGKGLNNGTVLSLYEDDDGNLWVGQNNGLAYIELGSPFSHLNEESGLPGTGYAAYLDNDYVYYGTNTGLYVKQVTEPLSSIHLVNNSSGQVYHIKRYGTDLLMGHHSGAYRIEGFNSTKISTIPGAWTFVSPNESSTSLIGGTYNGLQQFEKADGHWHFSKSMNGFEESSRVMELSNANDLWLTHGYKGAYKIQLTGDAQNIEKVSYYGKDKGFPSNNLINVYNIHNDLVFTSVSGIYKYQHESDRFAPDPFFSNLLGSEAQIWAMQEDAFGNIYFIGKDKMGVLKKNASGEYVAETDAFNRIRALLNDDLVNLNVLQNNEVLFGAKEGFVHYDPRIEKPKRSKFNTLIRSVSTISRRGDSLLFFGNHFIKDKIVADQRIDNKVELPYSHNSMMFRYAATSFEGSDIQYQYYLEKYESAWSEWSTLIQKEYTNLKEGKYVFHVRARNSEGIISEEATYTFYIQAPWFRSPWAYAVYTLSGMTVLLLGFAFVDRKYQRQQKLMELKQEKELHDKNTEMEKLSVQTQEEINRLQNEKLESELNHMKTELATATMHLLNKNEFIAGIKTDLNQIVKKNKHDDLKKELQTITKEIENNISSDSDWQHFQFHFDRVHGDFSNRFKVSHPYLSPQEIKLSAYLRMNLSTKEIAQLLHISVRGVEIGRYRLRKKLQLDRSRNLQDFILNF